MSSAIKDNRSRGKIGDFLKECIKDNSSLSIVSAYFTIYAYEKLKDHLHKDDDGRKKALVGSSNFTVSGLG